MNNKLISAFLGFFIYATLANSAYIYQQESSQNPAEGQYVSGKQQERYVALPLVQEYSQTPTEQEIKQQQEFKKSGTKQTIGQQEKRVQESFPEQEFDSELQEKPKEEKPKEEKPKEEKPKEEKPKEEKPKEEKPKKERPMEKKKDEKVKEEKMKKEKKEPLKVSYKSDKFNLEKETPEDSLRSKVDSQTLTINKEPSKQTGESVQKMNEFIRNLTKLMQNIGLMSANPQMGQQIGQVMDPSTYEQFLLQQDIQPQLFVMKSKKEMGSDDESDESMSEYED
jgi:hypothetical protein